MNRRQKIIVSVTGIFLVLLILVGLTYAYFLTRIDGNEANKSISVTTANLSLVYTDNSSELITSTAPIVPGKFKSSKTFTVTNNGNAKVDSYAVVLEKFSVKYVNDIPNTTIVANALTSLVNPSDMKMVITCTIISQNADRNGNDCYGVNGTLPTNNGVLVMNSIEMGDTHNYTMTLEYVETGNNQSDDMNKKIEGLINIIDAQETIDLKGTVDVTDVAYVEISENTSATQTTDTTDGTVEYLDELDSITNLESVAFETIRSYLNNNKEYRIVGIPAGNYNFKMYDNFNTQVGATQAIEILKGDIAGVSGNKITITNLSRETKINVNSTGNIIIDEEIKELGILSDTIIKRAKSISESDSKTLGYAKYSETYRTIPAEAPNASDEALLLTADDDYTTNTKMQSYYFRGNVKDNYVNFAGMCFKIVRIAGDGSVKLILEDRYTECNDNETEKTTEIYTGNWSDGNTYQFGYDDNYRADFLNYEGGLADSFKTFQTTLAKKINTNLNDESTQQEINDILSTKLKIDAWCYDDVVTKTSGSEKYYGAFTRIKTNKKPSLICTGTKLTKFKDESDMYVGTLTADEMAFAGANTSNAEENLKFYLTNAYSIKKQLSWWGLSLDYHSWGADNAFVMSYQGDTTITGMMSISRYSRPSINLMAGTLFTSGIGTQENPYVIAD